MLCGSRDSKGVIHLAVETAESVHKLSESSIALERIVSDLATKIESLVDVTKAHADRIGGIEGQRDKGFSWIVAGAIQIIVLLGGMLLGAFFHPVTQPGNQPTSISTH